MSLDLNKCVVLSAGMINLEATLQKVAEACQTFNASNSNDLERIGQVVNALFDEHKGAHIQMKALKTFTMGRLEGVTVANYSNLEERIESFVRGSADRFAIEKGPGKGVCRIADKPPVDPNKKSAK